MSADAKGAKKNQRSLEFHAKAAKFLKWSTTALDELREHGHARNMEDFERVFVGLLSLVATVHESLFDCARQAGFGAWSDELENVRRRDPLIFYLWNARNSETHDALVKWLPDMRVASYEIVDMQRALQIIGPAVTEQTEMSVRLCCFAFGVATVQEMNAAVAAGATPNPLRLKEAGLEMRIADSIGLCAFKIHVKGKGLTTVNIPASHLGRPIDPSGHSAMHRALLFYEQKLAELAQKLALPTSPALVPVDMRV